MTVKSDSRSQRLCNLEENLIIPSLLSQSCNGENRTEGRKTPKETRRALLESAYERASSTCPSNISFSRRVVSSGARKAGVCSAMSLSVASHFLDYKRQCEGWAPVPNTTDTPPSPLTFLTKATGAFKNGAPVTVSASQAVFSAIQVHRNVNPTPPNLGLYPLDEPRTKIEALASFYNLEVTRVSRPVGTAQDGLYSRIAAAIDDVTTDGEDGVYLMRALRSCAGPVSSIYLRACEAKNERYGHSTLIVREAGDDYFFDPRYGLMDVERSNLSLPQFLQWMIEVQKSIARFDMVRLYQLKETNT